MTPEYKRKIYAWRDTGKQEQLIRNLLQSQLSGVLATSLDGMPFCYLMAFLPADNLQSLFLAVSKRSAKHKQLANNPQTCFLIDNRKNILEDTSAACALNIHGRIYASRQSNLKDHFLARHPGLQSFVSDNETNIMDLQIDRYCLVSNFEDIFVVTPPV